MLKNKKIINALFLIIGSIGLIVSGLNCRIGIAAWIAPVFLLLFTRKTKHIHFLFFFLAMFVTGALSQTGGNLMNLFIVDIINGFTFGIAFTLIFFVDKLLYKKNGAFFYTLVFPVLITLLEFVSGFAVGTWGSLAHAHYEYKPIFQLASLTGVYGVWFLAGWFAAVVYWIAENTDDIKKIGKAVLIFGTVFFAVMLYGEIRINTDSEIKNTVKIAAVLSDTDIHQFAEEESELMMKAAEDPSTKVPDRIFSDSLEINAMINRTIVASKDADIIVWNEISLILDQSRKEDVINKIASICRENNVYVLTAFMEECTEENRKPFNNISVFISPDGSILWDYKKSFLEAVAEASIVNKGTFDMPVVETPYGNVGGVICADLDMLHYIKQASEKSVDLLLVPAYDWEGITPGHSEMSSAQAVQFGMSIVRVNGKGVTAFYDCKGKEIASMNTFSSDKKIFTVDLAVCSVKTVYSVTGDVFAYLCIAFLIFAVMLRIRKSKK